MRRTVSLLGLVAIGAVVWLVLGPGVGHGLLDNREKAREVDASVDPAQGASHAERRVDEVAREDVAAAVESTPAEVAIADAAEALVVGTIEVADEDDVGHTEESGTITATLWTGTESRRSEITVESGQFTLEIEDADRVEFSDARLGDRPLVLEEASFDLPNDSLDLFGSWYTPATLRVVDAVSGNDLRDLTVCLVDMNDGDAIHPGSYQEDSILAEGATSPVSLVPPGIFEHRCHVWVGAPGHAWNTVQVNFDSGGEHYVELEAGASLVVTLTGDVAALRSSPLQAEIRLRRPLSLESIPSLEEMLENWRVSSSSDYWDGVKPTEQEVRDQHARMFEDVDDILGDAAMVDPVRFDDPMLWSGLPCGDIVVGVEMGRSWDDPFVLGSARVALRAGQETRVTVDLIAPPIRAEPVPLAGTLFLPGAWGDKLRVVLKLEPRDLLAATDDDTVSITLESMQPVEGVPGHYRWDAGTVVPGVYRARVDCLTYEESIDTGPNGRTDVDIRIPPPADVGVQLVDPVTGLPVPDAELSWSCERPPGSLWGSQDLAHWDSGTQSYRFRAPATRVRLSTFLSQTADLDGPVVIDLMPGHNEFTFHVTNRQCVELVVQRNGKRVEVDAEWFWDIEIRAIGGTGKGRARIANETGGWMFFTEPGTYEIIVPDLPGYAPIEPFRIEVPAGETITHVLEVTRTDRP